MEPFRKNRLQNREINMFLKKFKLNRNLRRIPFETMHNMSMLRHRLTN